MITDEVGQSAGGAWLRQAPFAALRDIVQKRPSDGANLAALDGIRGIAVLIVIAGHTYGLHLRSHGAVGVWLFFSLSAFLLTMRFASHPERAYNFQHLRHYFRRRITRIFPMYYCILIASFLFSDRWTFDEWVRHLVFMQADGVYWSIPQELLFYLLLPVLVLLLSPVKRFGHAAMAIALLALAVASSLWLDTSVFRLNGSGKWQPFYFGVFASGMAFSYLYHWEPLSRFAAKPAINRSLQVLGVAVLAGVVFSAPFYQHMAAKTFPILGTLKSPTGWSYPGTYGLLCGGLIWIALVCRGRLLNRFLSSLPLRGIGLVSFSMYLLHYPVMRQIARLGAERGTELFVYTVLASYFFACLTYSVVERPFLKVSSPTDSPAAHP